MRGRFLGGSRVPPPPCSTGVLSSWPSSLLRSFPPAHCRLRADCPASIVPHKRPCNSWALGATALCAQARWRGGCSRDAPLLSPGSAAAKGLVRGCPAQCSSLARTPSLPLMGSPDCTWALLRLGTCRAAPPPLQHAEQVSQGTFYVTVFKFGFLPVPSSRI